VQCDQGEKTYEMYITIFEKIEVENSPIFEVERGTVVVWPFNGEADEAKPSKC
jgi:hypothetical protein